MSDQELEERARAAYEAYALKTGGRSFAGENLASWPDLPERIRDAWRDAAVAAVRWTPARERKATPRPVEGIDGHVARFDTSDVKGKDDE